MAGGLLQLSTLSAESLFLNGAPEITFFKSIYRRYTNFSIESLIVNFEDPVEFNSINTVKINQTGDLMHNVYLQVTLPEINLFRNTMPDATDFQIAYNDAQANYNIVLQFMSVNRVAYVNAYNIYIAENNTQNATADMILAINSAFANQTVIITQMQNLLLTSPNAPFTYDEISMQAIAGGFDAGSDKNALFKALSIGIDKSVKTQSYYYYQMYNAQVLLNDALDPNIKFAWIKRIGHFIAEYIEVRIGGHIIDKHYGSWLDIWYELTANRSIEETYFKLIGNVKELTNFNRDVKPQYILKIPLRFWFCRFSGLAIPLVALEYHYVSFNIKFRPIEQLSYIETDAIKYSLSPEGIDLAEVPDVLGIQISANLLIDYYYLDSSERRKFASSSHEYLIEQLQFVETPNINANYQIYMNSIVHPVKELIWVGIRQSLLENSTGFNQTQYGNYTTNNDIALGENNISFTTMDFNSYTRVYRMDSNYFNYVTTYESHYSTPVTGINVYSFSLYPEQFQPSGSANFSVISRLILLTELNSKLLSSNGTATDPLTITVFARNVNILRIIGGFGALSFTYLQ